MRTISLIVIHCSAVKPGQQSSVAQIDRWHRRLGWNGIGYHYVVRRSGVVEQGRPESVAGAHCANHNAHSIGVCYEGGLDVDGMPCDTRTEAQKESLARLLQELRGRYPNAVILGHNQLCRMKACPCFDAAREYREI
ncbi:MAG: N-acetylmuramoyl-L-alanine amidase [Bacteroides sp.]|nr:N-acetylmuramoyl-L-alanine amidase [Bacteroides sp.]MCM1447858.1 N-acetylmuramoyl-L-alanine amidase [Bacteroides sp.]MCM1515659.1 N-acetylmuramoyl-L-alanine amidase [Paraprevotella sp.]